MTTAGTLAEDSTRVMASSATASDAGTASGTKRVPDALPPFRHDFGLAPVVGTFREQGARSEQRLELPHLPGDAGRAEVGDLVPSHHLPRNRLPLAVLTC